MLFVKVSDSENDESVEVPVEPQGFILMSTLTAQFPGACGLKFKTEQFSWRGVRVIEDNSIHKLYPPGDDKWDSSVVYIVTYPKDSKRKGDDLDINIAKSRKIERKCVDLIVLGIPWKSTEEVVRRYFEQFGEVVLCEIKRDASNNSKGFGFVRFKEYNNQCSVLGKKHFIDGRWCDVKIPNSQEPETSRKIFVGRLSETLNSNDLKDYFAQFGQVIDVYIPKPFRAFGFVTFVEADIAQGLCGESHIIKGCSVHVSRADPKDDETHMGGGGGGMMNSNGAGNNHSHINHHHGANSHHGFNNNNNNRNESSSRRFSSNGHSSSNLNKMTNNGSSNGGMGNSKSMNQIRNKMKYDFHSGPNGNLGGGGGGGLNGNDLYNESRHNDVRSPNMHHHHHHGGIIGSGGGGNNGLASSNNGLNGMNGNHDQMSAMMSMFNPMMAAFIQQLASGIQPPNGPVGGSGQLDPSGGGHLNGSGLGGHHHAPPPWNNNNNDYNNIRNQTNGYNSSGGGYNGSGVGGGGGSQHSRFKQEKNF